MSWEYEKHEARCEACGHVGARISGSDDWGRSSTHWEGFDSAPPDATSVARRHADSRDSRPVCKCGSTSLVVGKLIGRA